MPLLRDRKERFNDRNVAWIVRQSGDETAIDLDDIDRETHIPQRLERARSPVDIAHGNRFGDFHPEQVRNPRVRLKLIVQFVHERVVIELRVREVQIDARLSVRRERLGVTDRTPQDPPSDLVDETILLGKGNELMARSSRASDESIE